jgi:hypothetical protein
MNLKKDDKKFLNIPSFVGTTICSVSLINVDEIGVTDCELSTIIEVKVSIGKILKK